MYSEHDPSTSKKSSFDHVWKRIEHQNPSPEITQLIMVLGDTAPVKEELITFLTTYFFQSKEDAGAYYYRLQKEKILHFGPYSHEIAETLFHAVKQACPGIELALQPVLKGNR